MWCCIRVRSSLFCRAVSRRDIEVCHCCANCRFITAPIELIKIHQQQSLEPIHIRGSPSSTTPTARALATQIFKERGLAGLYRGITATVLRDTGYGAYFLGVSIAWPYSYEQSTMAYIICICHSMKRRSASSHRRYPLLRTSLIKTHFSTKCPQRFHYHGHRS